jgi:DNA-binding transcriptional LysR family regulator
MDWDKYRLFLELMRTGSLSGAARSLGLTHPTLRRHLEDMEYRLGVVLFTRSPDGLKPTAAALKLEQSAIMMESAAETLLRRATADTFSETGVVKIVCSEIMALEVLPPVFARLRSQHPGLHLDVAVDANPTRVLQGSADISLQMARPSEVGVVARLACRIEIGLFAHARYIAQAGVPATLEDLRSMAVIGSNTPAAGLDVLRDLGLDIEPDAFVFRTESQYAQLAAIRAGAGIGAIQVPLAIQDPAMVRILPHLKTDVERWLVTHDDLLFDRRVRIVHDLIAVHLAAYARGGGALDAERDDGQTDTPRLDVS